MAEDPNPALSAELTAARAVLAPQLRGSTDFQGASISAELRTVMQTAHTDRARRDSLLQAALAARDAYIAALDALENDGYPELPDVQIPGSLLSEIKEQQSDFTAAADMFEAAHATSINVTLGQAEPKP